MANPPETPERAEPCRPIHAEDVPCDDRRAVRAYWDGEQTRP